MDELMAFLEISRWTEEKTYELIVVDSGELPDSVKRKKKSAEGEGEQAES